MSAITTHYERVIVGSSPTVCTMYTDIA